jgi:hypothetical protein
MSGPDFREWCEQLQQQLSSKSGGAVRILCTVVDGVTAWGSQGAKAKGAKAHGAQRFGGVEKRVLGYMGKKLSRVHGVLRRERRIGSMGQWINGWQGRKASLYARNGAAGGAGVEAEAGIGAGAEGEAGVAA